MSEGAPRIVLRPRGGDNGGFAGSGRLQLSGLGGRKPPSTASSPTGSKTPRIRSVREDDVAEAGREEPSLEKHPALVNGSKKAAAKSDRAARGSFLKISQLVLPR